MGFFENLGEAIDKGLEAIGSVLEKVGTIVKEIGVAILLAMPIPQLKLAGVILQGVFKLYDVIAKDMNLDEFGDRVMQAAEAGIRMDRYGTWSEYYEAVRNFPLDPVKTEYFPPEYRMVAGISAAMVGLSEKISVDVRELVKMPIVVGRDPDFFSAQRIEAILSSKEPGLLFDYFRGSLGRMDDIRAEKILIDVEKRLDPGKNDDEIRTMLRKESEYIQTEGT